jgi:ABC-2 type transport system ATP-binding protein
VIAVEVAHLVKRYRGAARNAVDDISFEVPAGQLCCLLGPNGAGKTTTVSVLTTTLAPTAGRVRIAGADLAAQQSLVRRRTGVVFQQPSLDLNLTAEENIRLHAVLYGVYPWRPAWRLMPAAYRSQVRDLAGVLGVADLLGVRARALSGGLRRRLEIVRALLHRPEVLFLDEPTAGLDPESRRALWAYLSEARASAGTTIVLTTHYLAEAEAADAICVIAAGKIIERGTPAELKARHLRPAESPGLAGPAAPGEPPAPDRPGGGPARLDPAGDTLEAAYLALLDQARAAPAGDSAAARPLATRASTP